MFGCAADNAFAFGANNQRPRRQPPFGTALSLPLGFAPEEPFRLPGFPQFPFEAFAFPCQWRRFSFPAGLQRLWRLHPLLPFSWRFLPLPARLCAITNGV